MSGSIWNPNSWHWEERNYDKWSRTFLESRLKTALSENNEIDLNVYDVKFDGHATVSIRKAKQIVAFDYNITGKWKSSLEIDNDEDTEIKGSFDIQEFSVDSVDDGDYTIQIKVNDDCREHKDKMKTTIEAFKKMLIKMVLEPFPRQLLEYDTEKEKSRAQNTAATDTKTVQVVPREAIKIENQPIKVDLPLVILKWIIKYAAGRRNQ
ncbi:bifunctional Activator of Hsp90 ATPase [Babesia duncani]|uniref:Bifunctional Activator of Hsp90 ATPase n=1 Tax=Babesia duncani TaxID=323732 RepID=A0AAD9PMC3_9APIC|nr:bifunctional Activator of Hsp90 ATPase [Babesia duncani]